MFVRWKIVRWLGICLVCLALVIGALTASAFLSPWPGALAIRFLFDRGAADASQALVKHLPASTRSQTDIVYDPTDRDALLDIHYPQMPRPGSPLVIWIHGGAWLSGSKSDVANYLKMLTGKGFTTVSIGYSLAPASTYPKPLRQVNAAIAYLIANQQKFGIDATRIVLAGDSAGAQLSAQTAAMATAQDYAHKVGIVLTWEPSILKGVILFCGPYDVEMANLDGPFGFFLRTVLWSYSGTKDFRNDSTFKLMSVRNHVTAHFPRTFISAGNGDPLAPQSVVLADRLKVLGVPTETMFFSPDYTPKLPHEYQFNLDQEAGKQAFDRMVRFLEAIDR